MAAVRSEAPAPQNPGIDYAGNDTYKALSMRAYHEATKHLTVSVRAGGREFQTTD